jgi:biopolymer transport protein ExbD
MDFGGDKGNIKSEINVTPLVDVCLVLLIIFMVVTPLLTGGDVALPKTKSPSKKPEDEKQITLIVAPGNPVRYWFADKPMPKVLLEQTVDEEYQRNSSRPVVIKADHRLTWAQVRDVMKIAKDAGFENVGLIAEKLQQPGK